MAEGLRVPESAAPLDLSVVIPSYQSARWLPSTLEHCLQALLASGWRGEVVVVDDGSTDDTRQVVERLAATSPVPVRLLQQANSGRFLARWAGLEAARGRLVLLLDSRVLLGHDSLAHVRAEIECRPDRPVWNGHAVTDPAAALVGHFWEVPTHVFWGGYLGTPRPSEFGTADFNRYPKGTGVFLAPRDLLVQACRSAWPEGDAALASDDTKLIRHLAAVVPVRIDPSFCAVYRPRTSVRAFVAHSFARGTFLVDSFGGTSTTWNALLLALLVAPVAVLLLLVATLASGLTAVALGAVAAGLLGLLAPAVMAAVRGCPRRGLAAYVVYLPVFGAPYWAGLVRGVIVHRSVLRCHRAEALA